MRAKQWSFNAGLDPRGSCHSAFFDGWLDGLPGAVEQRGKVTGDSDMRKAIASIRRHLDIDHPIGAVLLKDLYRQPAVSERLAGLLGIKRAGQILREPFEADLHESLATKVEGENLYGLSPFRHH